MVSRFGVMFEGAGFLGEAEMCVMGCVLGWVTVGMGDGSVFLGSCCVVGASLVGVGGFSKWRGENVGFCNFFWVF